MAHKHFSDRRVTIVWPDVADMDGYQALPGYFICCCLAGEATGILPHQGMTNLQVAGIDAVPRTTKRFNRSQLNILAGGGIWFLSQDAQSGLIFTRHAVTSAPYDDINQREEMITRNVDDISFYFLDVFSPYIGISNVTVSLLTALQAEINAAKKELTGRNFVSAWAPSSSI